MKEENSNGLHDIIAQAIEEMKHEQGKNFSLDKINLAELQRRTGISRALPTHRCVWSGSRMRVIPVD